MQLNRVNNMINRDERNKLNQNFATIEQSYARVTEASVEAETQAIFAQQMGDYAETKGDYASNQGEYAKLQGDRANLAASEANAQSAYAKSQGDYAKQIADANKNVYLAPVANYSAITTTYPNPVLGSKVQTMDDGKIYRYNGTTWQYVEVINSNVLTDMQIKLSETSRQTSILEHGTSIINGEPSPVYIEIQGRTLVNLIYSASPFTIALDATKYYLLINSDGTAVMVDGVSQTVPHKFTNKSTITLTWSSGNAALYEVTLEDYNKILVDWTASAVANKYPYVQGVKHLANPYLLIEGENLLPPFTEWTLHANAKIISPYELELNTTAANQFNTYNLKLVSGQQYTLSFEGSMNVVYVIFNNGSGGYSGSSIVMTAAGTRTFTVPTGTDSVNISAYSSAAGTFTLSKIMLAHGAITRPFIPKNPSNIYVEAKLGAIGTVKDALFEQDGKWKVQKRLEKDTILDGSLAWIHLLDNTRFKGAQITLPNGVNTYSPIVVTKHNGKVLQTLLSGSPTSGDLCWTGVSNAFRISISDADSGWLEAMIPTSDMIKAYFNGWKYVGDGTTHSWVSIIDGSAPSTNTIAYVSENKATGYTPYKLSYVLASPTTIDITDKVEGDLALSGSHQITVGSGFTYTTVDGKRTYTLTSESQRYLSTVNATEVKLTYANNIRSALEDSIVKQSDMASMLSVHERAIIDLYVKYKALGGV